MDVGAGRPVGFAGPRGASVAMSSGKVHTGLFCSPSMQASRKLLPGRRGPPAGQCGHLSDLRVYRLRYVAPTTHGSAGESDWATRMPG